MKVLVSALWMLLLLLAPPGANAQSAAAGVSSELVEKLLARIESLEKRVTELEGPRAAAPAAESPKPAVPVQAQAPPPALEHAEHLQPSGAADVQGTFPSMKISGFSDVNFAATDQRGARSGFSEGQFILHMSSALAPRVSVFGELSFTARNDAGTGTPGVTGFNAEVERAIIRFDQSDRLKISFGRYHTPINYWNTAFHHGQWLQTSISRPEMTQFGGRFIPVHFVGGLLEGALPAGGMNLNYNVGMGNGRGVPAPVAGSAAGSVLSRGGDAGDSNNNKAWLVTLFSRPDRLYGLQFGGSVYRDKITLADGRNFREWITSGHLVWSKENPEIIAEAANVHHQEVARTYSTDSQAYYVQIGYRLPAWQRLWKPYYRFDYIHIPRGDAVFQGTPSLAGSTVGLRYDLSSFAAVKGEYRNIRRPGVPRINGMFFQTSFVF